MSIESSNLSSLRVTSYAAAAVGVVQFGLGGYLISAEDGPVAVHNIIGFIALATVVLATFASFRWKGEGGNPGLFFHAAGMVAIGLIQYAIGEIGSLAVFHILLGMAYVAGVVALAVLVTNKPYATP